MDDNYQPGQSDTLPDILEPIQVITAQVGVQKELKIPAGYVLITALDANGNEIPKSAFFYPERTYKRYYADETKFSITKNQLITDNTFYYENLNRTSQQIISSTGGRCSSCRK